MLSQHIRFVFPTAGSLSNRFYIIVSVVGNRYRAGGGVGGDRRLDEAKCTPACLWRLFSPCLSGRLTFLGTGGSLQPESADGLAVRHRGRSHNKAKGDGGVNAISMWIPESLDAMIVGKEQGPAQETVALTANVRGDSPRRQHCPEA